MKKCFLGFRTSNVGLVREKTHRELLCHGGIKAREKLYVQLPLRAFFNSFFGNNKSGGVCSESKLDESIRCSFLEIFWVIGLTHAYDFWTWTGTVICIIVSNYLMITAAQVLPAGTVYAIFVGLGTAGTVIAGFLFFGEAFKWEKVILIATLLAGVMGLKLVTPDKAEKGAES